MEPGDHLKNGASPKSQTSRSNYILVYIIAILLSSCSITYPTMLTNHSKKDKACYESVKKGLNSIMEEQGIILFGDSFVQNIVDSKQENYTMIMMGKCIYYFTLINSGGKPYLCMYQKNCEGKIETKMGGKGLASYKLDNCECNK
jgi:hypothetical protein